MWNLRRETGKNKGKKRERDKPRKRFLTTENKLRDAGGEVGREIG